MTIVSSTLLLAGHVAIGRVAARDIISTGLRLGTRGLTRGSRVSGGRLPEKRACRRTSRRKWRLLEGRNRARTAIDVLDEDGSVLPLDAMLLFPDPQQPTEMFRRYANELGKLPMVNRKLHLNERHLRQRSWPCKPQQHSLQSLCRATHSRRGRVNIRAATNSESEGESATRRCASQANLSNSSRWVSGSKIRRPVPRQSSRRSGAGGLESREYLSPTIDESCRV